jgi:hypothetical protein
MKTILVLISIMILGLYSCEKEDSGFNSVYLGEFLFDTDDNFRVKYDCVDSINYNDTLDIKFTIFKFKYRMKGKFRINSTLNASQYSLSINDKDIVADTAYNGNDLFIYFETDTSKNLEFKVKYKTEPKDMHAIYFAPYFIMDSIYLTKDTIRRKNIELNESWGGLVAPEERWYSLAPSNNKDYEFIYNFFIRQSKLTVINEKKVYYRNYPWGKK